jgi:hypothetical protein
MTIKSWACIALMTAIAVPIESQAATSLFVLTGPGLSASLSLSYEIDNNTAAVLNTSPDIHDPLGSYIITGVTGNFSDTASGITNATITGLESLNQVMPESTNLKAPSRFSLLKVANGVDDGSGHPSAGFHYDNIFYPAGSPQTASDYPFSGGILDIYGVAFTLDSGDAVNLWSNGKQPGIGLNYGVAITNRIDVIGYTNGVSVQAVPEPTISAMMLAGFGAAGTAIRRRGKTAGRFA